MRKIKKILIFVIFAAFLALSLFAVKLIKPSRAGIKVTSNPVSGVYINGKYVGKTTFSGTFPPGQISLKLVPQDTSLTLSAFETTVNLVPGIETYIDREFAESEDASGGVILSFEKIGGREAGLIAISSPDKAEVWIDGAFQGSTPYNFNSITTGPHTIAIKNSGYKERILNIKTVDGLRLTLYAKLSKVINDLPTATPTVSLPEGPKKYVLVGTTSTGFLRLRTAPEDSGDEIAELKSGQKYVYLETDQATGWYKILYEDPSPGLPNGITGWVSNQYSSVVD